MGYFANSRYHDWVCNLVELLEQCQQDTKDVLGEGAAARLSHWQKYRDDKARLIKFIQDRIHSDTWENGARLHQKGKLSLERIVLKCGLDVFEAGDIERARQTLKMAQILPP